ncbi:MAG: 3-methyl-2-oxobutanoate hydroxymethyltransferase [Peptococcaceae bacterium]|nr:3-methyl-2-oxobutanoate hydroxymethyltransferase [Peptococcaceae bacterium]
MAEKVTVADFRRMKGEGTPITMLTAYDCNLARLVDEAGIDSILVGDSLGNVVLGYQSTIPVTMDDMIHHVKAVSRGTRRALLVGDMPFLSYHLSRERAIANAGRFLQEGGAQAVKLEGGREVAEAIRGIVEAGIPVVAHLGLTPQSVNQLGGYLVQGRDEKAARKLIDDALAVEEAGAFALVLECVPEALATYLSRELSIPTIGIGAGAGCDGQVLVSTDMLGLYGNQPPRFVRQFANLNAQIREALAGYREEVRARTFPAAEHTFAMPEGILEKVTG